MPRKSILGSVAVLVSTLVLTVLVLVISYSIVGERLEKHVLSVPEEQRLNMVEGADSAVIPEELTLADGVTCVSDILDENGEHLAYVIDTVSDGSDGKVVVRVAFDEDRCISGLQVLETAGLPTNLGFKAASSEYLDQYLGASAITSDSRSVSGKLIRSIDGADYSCAGVYSCVTAAFTQLKLIEEAEEEENGQ